MRARGEFRAGRLFFWAVLFGMPFLVQLVFLSGQFSGLQSPQALDHAQVARNLAEGHGFTTEFIRPLSLVFVASAKGHPDLANAPLHPLLLSLAFRVLPMTDNTVVLVSVLFWAGSVWLVFFLTQRLFGRKTATLAAAVAMLSLNPMLLSMGSSAAVVAMFLTLLLFLLLVKRAQAEATDGKPQSWRPLAAIGAVLGLLVLTDYYFLAIVIPVLLYLVVGVSERRDWRSAGLVAAAFAVVLLPWMIRNAVVVHNPFFTLAEYDVAARTGIYPGNSVYQHLDPQVAKSAAPLSFAWGNLRSVALKVRTGLRPLLESLPAFGGMFVGPLFFASLFLLLEKRSVRNVRRLFYGAAVSLALFMLIGAFTRESIVAFEPFAVIFAVGLLQRFLGPVDTEGVARAWRQRNWPGMWKPGRKLLVAGVFLILAALPLSRYVRIAGADEKPSMIKYDYLASQGPSDGLLMSDAPWVAAWYCNRPSVWLTQAAGEYDLIAQRVAPVTVLHFSGAFRTDPATAWGDWWQAAALSSEPYKGLVHVYAPSRGEIVRRRAS